MGLDMYLRKKTYIGNQHKDDASQIKIILDCVKQARVSEIVEQIGYWRKANAIHCWFVNNVQDGVDDCREYEVSREELKDLLDLVNQVLEASELVDGKVVNGYTFKDGRKIPNFEKGMNIKDSSVADQLLPTQSGCFFGSPDYDQWYVDNLKYTKAILEGALEEDGGDFYYQSSW
jgi:hypothetical protein